MWPLLAAPLLASAPPPLPPPLPLSQESAPSAPEEYLRRNFELHLHSGVTALRCNDAAPSSLEQLDLCAQLQSPWKIGASLFWRTSVHWGLGLAADGVIFDFSLRDSAHNNSSPGKGRWTNAALLARWYPFSNSPWEPYIGYQAGLGWLTLQEKESTIVFQREGIVMAAHLGLERWISSRLRLGIAGEVRWQANGTVESCDSTCLSLSSRIPDRSLSLQISLSAAFGDEL